MPEFKAAVLAVCGLAFSLLFGVIAFRVIIPAILEAHFEGGTLVASLAGLAVAGLLVAFTAWWVRLVARRLRGSSGVKIEGTMPNLIEEREEREAERKAAAAEARQQWTRRIKFFGAVGGLALFLLVSGCTVLSHSTTIQSGEVGILNKTFGANAGVQPTELRPGWHWRGIGEQIIKYSTRQRIYSFTREANSDGKENEEIAFADQTGLPMTADVQLTIKVQDNRAAEIFAKYRLNFDDLIDGPIRNDTRSFLSRETEKVPVSCNLNQPSAAPGGAPTPRLRSARVADGRRAPGGAAEGLRAAAGQVGRRGVEISDLQWVGTIRYPDAITNAIKARTETEQRTLAAQQRKAEAEANAAAQIETARGIAESTRLRGGAAGQSGDHRADLRRALAGPVPAQGHHLHPGPGRVGSGADGAEVRGLR
uniref:SPFH domain-containing protein n=1 Tax=Phenylobacterium glaciei TaxID=2803784 RepID=A0A974P361_9CAUL|nr:SPFH domain-containing protein [Phenylobacterium glaciei]